MPGDRKHHTEKFRRCVEKVMAQGKDEDSAYAICTTSLKEAGEAIFEGAEMHTLHLLGATGKVRTEMLDGREHLVVPVVALMEGVIHPVNAETPEFVPWKTIERIADSFNGKPVVLNHPVKDGKQCSASLPGVAESHGIGTIRNSRAENKKLLQEAWIDATRAKQLHPEMYQRLLDEKPEEVSVGAFVITDEASGNFNGRSYKAQWLGGYGDHLAFLPGKRGACSVAMGCGAHRAAMLVTAEGFVDMPEIVPMLVFMSLEGQSLDERMQAVQAAINERWNRSTGHNGMYPTTAYALQTFDDRVIVNVEGQTFDVSYEVDKDGKVTLEEPKRVKQAWVAAARKGRYEDCKNCKGTGSKDGNPCEACDGEGEVKVAALAALLGACGCNKAVKEIHAHAVKALGDRPGHPFYGNQHETKTSAERILDEMRERIKFEGGHWVLYGKDNTFRLGQYKTKAEAEEHGQAIQRVLMKQPTVIQPEATSEQR